jgi:hypothetical protein
VSTGGDNLKRYIDEHVSEVRVAKKVSEDVACCPARPFVGNTVVVSGYEFEGLVGRADDADAAVVQPLSVGAEGFAIAFGELDGVIIAPNWFEGVG